MKFYHLLTLLGVNFFQDETPIIPKPLGGYKREQLNEIFLIGVLIHQLYFSNLGNNLTESQQKKSLDIQMSFFITVHPHKNKTEYFDFAERFINQNSNIFNLSISESIERSIQILSSCESKQIAKLRKLFQALASCYSEIGGGNKIAMTAYVSMVDTGLSGLMVEED